MSSEIEYKGDKSKAVLVGVINSQQDESKVREYLDELEFLATTDGIETLKRYVQKLATIHPKTLIGKAARVLERTLTEETFPIYTEILKSEAERAKKLYRMALIPGFEITQNTFSNHRSSHMLALGIEHFVSANGSVIEIARKIREKGGLVVAAHPVNTGKYEKQTYHLWDNRFDLAKEFDAWEVASGPIFFKEVHESGLPMLANSDLHSAKQITSWKTVFQCEKKAEAILDAIRKQKLDFKFYQEQSVQSSALVPAWG